MKGVTRKSKLLQWHAAFFAGIQIEFEQEAEHLVFENEHMLSTKPMQLDVLIIKKDKTYKVQKNIGRMFRTYNIVEYKSPDDYLSVDDFFKVYGYTCFYKSDTGKINEIKADEVTITFVCNRYPRELFRYLKQEQEREITEEENGIYHISDSLFDIQVIVQKNLSEDENLWLQSLTNDLKEKQKTEKLLIDYKKHEKQTLYRSIMNIIVNANRERFEVNDMCEALDEILEFHFKGKLEEGWRQGMEKGLEQGLEQKLLSQITKKLMKGKSLAQIADELEETEESILPLYNRAKEEMGIS